MIFKKGTGVRTADGKGVGKLDRVVVDPRTKEVNYIVVQQGGFGSSDSGKVVPLTLVAAADDDGITLREDAGDAGGPAGVRGALLRAG